MHARIYSATVGVLEGRGVGVSATPLREDPSRAVIIGAGRGGSAIIEMLHDEDLVDIVAVVDVDPDAPGLKLARKYGIAVYHDAAEALQQNAPCVAFNMSGNEMVEAVAADILGAGGVIGGLEARLIWRMVTNLKQAKAELRRQATHDALTGAYNRHFGMEQLRVAISRFQRHGHPFSVVMLDVDHFKAVNDRYGHAAGDAVLCRIAAMLRNHLRQADFVCRWGGEEFLVILPDTERPGAAQAAGNWLKALAHSPVQLATGRGESIVVSFSAGVASFSEVLDGADPSSACRDTDAALEALLHLADQRLYQAKAAGRARVEAGEAVPL